MNFEFANPEFLWLLLGLPILAILRGAGGKSGSLIFSSVAVAKDAAKRNRASAGFWRFSLTLLALALLIVAFARPRIGMGYSEREESGIDIVLTIDVSGSMAGLDFSESRNRPMTRLDAVKEVVDAFIGKRPNDRIALDANSRVVRDRAGNPVYGGDMRSEIDEDTLRKISEITGGKFYRATNLKELAQIYSEIDKLEKTSVKLRNFTSYRELFQWFAGAAAAVLALKLILVNTKFRILP